MRLLCVLIVFTSSAMAEDLSIPTTEQGPTTEKEIGAYYEKATKHPRLRFGNTLAVGQIGLLPYDYDPAKPAHFAEFKILQVVDDDEMLLDVTIYTWKSNLTNVGGRDIVGAARPTPSSSMQVWLKGVSTAGQVDGKRIAIGGGFKIAGTKTYEAATGKRTVYLLEPFALPKIAVERAVAREGSEKEIEKKVAAQQAEEAKAAIAKANEAVGKGRLWKNKDGNEIGRGDFVQFKRGFVDLLLENGKTKTLSLAQLSKEDRDWVRINAGKK